jgi:Flp pilus assembly protein TadG
MPRGQRGVSLSAMFAVIVLALLLMAGLVVDGGAQAEASRRAESAAASAARAAADETATARLAGRSVDTGAAIAAAQRVLGEAEVAGTVSLTGGRVLVSTRAEADTVFLSLIGINKLAATGSAEAELVAND